MESEVGGVEEDALKNRIKLVKHFQCLFWNADSYDN